MAGFLKVLSVCGGGASVGVSAAAESQTQRDAIAGTEIESVKTNIFVTRGNAAYRLSQKGHSGSYEHRKKSEFLQ